MPSLSWSYGSWIYNWLFSQLVPIIINVVTIKTRCTRYNIASDLRRVAGFLYVLRFPLPMNWPPRYYWMLLKVALNTNHLRQSRHPLWSTARFSVLQPNIPSSKEIPYLSPMDVLGSSVAVESCEPLPEQYYCFSLKYVSELCSSGTQLCI
jgi:hypothetical protein